MRTGRPAVAQTALQLRRKVAEHKEQYGTGCNCKGPCDTSNPDCLCMSKMNFCEVFCACGPSCKNRYAGCNCKRDCGTKACPCFASGRECDPDLCGCAASRYADAKCDACMPEAHLEPWVRPSLIGKGRGRVRGGRKAETSWGGAKSGNAASAGTECNVAKDAESAAGEEQESDEEEVEVEGEDEDEMEEEAAAPEPLFSASSINNTKGSDSSSAAIAAAVGVEADGQGGLPSGEFVRRPREAAQPPTLPQHVYPAARAGAAADWAVYHPSRRLGRLRAAHRAAQRLSDRLPWRAH